jgi:hypothetical protein
MDDAAKRLTWPVTSTRRLHRRDVRTVADLRWGSSRVVLHRHVRQFCCANGRCPRRLFPERPQPLSEYVAGPFH